MRPSLPSQMRLQMWILSPLLLAGMTEVDVAANGITNTLLCVKEKPKDKENKALRLPKPNPICSVDVTPNSPILQQYKHLDDKSIKLVGADPSNAISINPNDVVIVYTGQCHSSKNAKISNSNNHDCLLSCNNDALLQFAKLAINEINWANPKPTECKVRDMAAKDGFAAYKALPANITPTKVEYVVNGVVIIIIKGDQLRVIDNLDNLRPPITFKDFQALMAQAAVNVS